MGKEVKALDSLGVWKAPPNLPTDLSTGIVDISRQARLRLDSCSLVLSQYDTFPMSECHVPV